MSKRWRGLTDRKIPEIPVIFVEGASVSVSEVKSQVHPFMATQYSTKVEESPAAAPNEVASIDVHTGDLEGKVDWHLANLTGGPD